MRSLARSWLLVLLVLAILGSQSLALLHRVAHQPAHAAAVEHEHHDAHAAPEGADHGLLEGLFALDEEGLACQLLDQLGHGAQAAGAALAAAILAAPYLLPWLQARAPGRPAALFEARAPPF